MTHRKAVLHYCAAFIGWLVLANFCTSFTKAQDVSTNEVIPLFRGIKVPNITTTKESGRVVVCPGDPPNPLIRLLAVNCEKSSECQFLGVDQRCCRGICRRGIEPPINEPPHGDLLGIRRKCPAFTFPERMPIRRCSRDADCEGVNRICCPDKTDKKLYCRTATPIWSQLPFPNNQNTLNSLMGFIQCQPAPPPVLDIFSRPCDSTVDCLPNLCCQEGSKKVCRPPRRSILSLVAQATNRFIKG